MLKNLVIFSLAIVLSFGATVKGQSGHRGSSSPYLFVWAGDADGKESDFLAVIDVRPNSKRYGRIVTTRNQL